MGDLRAYANRDVGFIYGIQCQTTKLIKIGFATDPRKRIRDISTMCPTTLKVVAIVEGVYQKDEFATHDRLRDYRWHGEWFSLPAEELMEYLCGAFPGYRVTDQLPGPPLDLTEGRPPPGRQPLPAGKIVELYRRGLSLKQVATRYGCSPNRVAQMMDSVGEARRRQPK